MIGPGAARALKIAVVAMGIVIVVGTAALVVAIVHRVSNPRAASPLAPAQTVAVPPVLAPPSAAAPISSTTPPSGNLVLDEPAGTRIAAVAILGDGLAVTLTGGGPDRVVLLDHALRAIGRLSLAR